MNYANENNIILETISLIETIPLLGSIVNSNNEIVQILIVYTKWSKSILEK